MELYHKDYTIHFTYQNVILLIFNSKYNIGVQNKPYIVVSVGMPGDHHVRKSYIDPHTCIGCKICIPVCPTKAIPENFVENFSHSAVEYLDISIKLCPKSGAEGVQKFK